MATPWERRTQLELPINFQTQNEAFIAKGTIMQLLDARTASGSQVSGMAVAGICSRDRPADSGREVSIYLRSIFDVGVSGNVVIGAKLGASEGFGLTAAGTTATGRQLSGLHVCATALEAGTSEETIQVILNVGGA